MAPYERLRAKVLACGGPPAVVMLEEFFEGNDDESSIGCNLPEHPGLDAFYLRLAWIPAVRK